VTDADFQARVASIVRDYPLPSLFPELREVAQDKWRGCCPLHGGDNRSGFGVERYNGRWSWRCFTGDCGGGSAIDAWLRLNGGTFMEALDILDGGVTVNSLGSTYRSGVVAQALRADRSSLVLICDACRDETLTVESRVYGNGRSRPNWTDSAYGAALGSGWEIGAQGIACVGPRCLGRIAA